MQMKFPARSLRFLSLFVLILFPLSISSCAFWRREAPKRPNIIFILADDLGWTDTGVYKSRYYETPNIDRLAAEGMRFTRHHSGPNCTPSRAALMTGQYGPRTGMYTVGSIERFDWRTRPLRPVDNVTELPLEKTTIANQLQNAGYVTGMFGKWHLGDRGQYHPSQRGFDEAIVTGSEGHFEYSTTPRDTSAKGKYLADYLTEKATDFITRHKDERFFLYLPHFAVHGPHQAKAELKKKFAAKHGSDGHKNPTYAAMIASLDESIGAIQQTLENLNLADETVVIFSSDNGGVGGYAREGIQEEREVTDNAPLRSGKGSLYEGGTRVPLIVRWPGVTDAGTTANISTIHVDVFPTLLEIADVPAPNAPMDGESLVSLLANSDSKLKRDAIFQHFPGYLGSGDEHWRTTPVGTIEVGDWKLMEFFEDGRLELYNLRHDIGETKNLAEEFPDVAMKLHQRLVNWREEIHAPMPTPNSSLAQN